MDPLTEIILSTLRSTGGMSEADLVQELNQRDRLGVLPEGCIVGGAAVIRSLRSLELQWRAREENGAWEWLPERKAVEASGRVRQASLF